MIRKDYKNTNFKILFYKVHENIEILKSNIVLINNSCIKIKFYNFSDFLLSENIEAKGYFEKLNIIIDTNHSKAAFKLCGNY